tara:strand:- start:19221 stop:19517 length:297 start_codon:yes stop_codon:yes gene_type:complete
MLIYHIANNTDWERAQAAGSYECESLHAEGFIHLSTKSQLEESLNIYFKDRTDITILELDSDKIKGTLKWEHSKERGEDFPHLYNPLNVSAVVSAKAR